jgi:DNA-binding response OmpR family regulator
MIERSGGVATVVSDGGQAQALIASSIAPYGVVIADAMTAVVDGYSVLQAARDRSKSTVLALMGFRSASGEDDSRAMHDEFRRLAKPVTLVSVVDLLSASYVGGKQP